jgi:hypothetical protein
MKAYIQTDKFGNYFNVNAYVANDSFQTLGYALDFGIDENNTMKLVEVNDGHSLGTYGLGATNYAKFLSARWAQLTNTRDYAYF